MQELDRAPFGIVGLETAWRWSSTQLIEPGHLIGPGDRKADYQSGQCLGHQQRHLAMGPMPT